MKTFKVDARTLLTLGRDSIRDHKTALLELVKNSYDADASKVEVEINMHGQKSYIRIADNGIGMSEQDFEDFWLRIGYSDKRNKKISGKKRRKTGEKGIGRISADRLGSILSLVSKAKGHDAFGLEINWEKFDVQGEELSSIPIEEKRNPKITIPKKKGDKGGTGTELIITSLRHKWKDEDVLELRDEFAILTPPFKAVSDFEINLTSNVVPNLPKKIESPLYSVSEIDMHVQYDGNENVVYTIVDRISKVKHKEKVKVKWTDIISKMSSSDSDDVSEKLSCGPVDLKLLFYPRVSGLLEGTKFSLSDLREFLDKNAGVKIYRDNVRVKPYGSLGSSEGDWLSLGKRRAKDPAGVGRKTYKVADHQLVGAVFVGRDKNVNLVDSSGREGLVEGAPFNDLKSFTLGCISLLEAHRYERMSVVQKDKPLQRAQTVDAVKDISKDSRTVVKELKSFSKVLPHAEQKKLSKTIDKVEEMKDKLEDAVKSVEQMSSQASVFRGLATLGIASAVFGHETQSSIDEFVTASYAASSFFQKHPDRKDVIKEELDKALKYSQRVSSWGSFALARVQGHKRNKKTVNIASVIEETVNEVKAVFESAHIKVILDLDDITGKVYIMDIESILLNLMTNAYFFCLKGRDGVEKVKISLKSKKMNSKDGFQITVADSGCGIDENLRSKIWTPLFSTKYDSKGKSAGTGLGLTIVQSIIEDLEGISEVDNDPKLKGARFKIWIPLN